MGLILDKGLQHQQNAMVALNHVFRSVQVINGQHTFKNPIIDLSSKDLKINLLQLKKQLPYQIDNDNTIDGYLNLDIKMETGTGKTYVYTQSIFELHRNYGINKFIILVPTVAIKIGTTNFINSEDTRRHFREIYNAEIDLTIYDAKKNKKEVFPNAVREFVSASGLIKNQISVLIINNLVSQASLTKNYSSGVEGYYSPVEALKATKPFVIIDEPHRFGKSAKTFNFIQERIQPQCIIRYGATFPDLKGGKKDYHNLIYNLGSCDSFNQNLIKGVSVTPLETPNGTNVKIKLKSIESKTSAIFELNQNGRKYEKQDFKRGDSLGLAYNAFAGLLIDGIGKNYIELSNGKTLNIGEELYADIYDSSYQESMIDVALDSHFKTEKTNFLRRDQIKTIALFFIDDISSYRGSSEKAPYLKEYFEKSLAAKIKDELTRIDMSIPREVEYIKYLEESLKDISATHGGYFSQDNSDKEYEDEIERILKKKEETISLKIEGKYNIFRFIFSKWTLKEGWDNPNVFTIAKIRSSGSEISKIQEVGRGLRLPVNSSFSRVSSEQFYLNYIVDFTEKDFAQRLIDEINGELKEQLVLSEEVLKKVAVDNGYSNYHSFVGILIDNDFINDNLVVNTEKRDDLFALYPDLATGLASGKVVTTPPKVQMQDVKINKNNYAKLKNLWKSLNSKYYITYQPVDDSDIINALINILKEGIE
ncbi:MAG: type III restriction-modification system endonuclease, partial [Bacilli bacterium]|nr:type III restriction-modification system endonuclease [Bacilli bacterium]